MQPKITGSMTIEQILTQYPGTLAVFQARGFEQFSDPAKVQTIGRFLKLQSLAKQGNYDLDALIGLLEEATGGEALSASSRVPVRVEGLLPCPVRLPLSEAFGRFSEEFTAQTGVEVKTTLEAAAVGAKWIEEHIRTLSNHEELPDILVSAGFDTFFDPKLIGAWKQEGVFCDTTAGLGVNEAFRGVDIRDPRGDYGMFSVVPAVFVIHQDNYPDLEAPRTWEELLHPRYEKKVALPVSDFDLFNGILLNLHKEFGDEGIVRLGRSMDVNLHPAQMVRASNRASAHKPFVTVMPYFFTRMLRQNSSARSIWPEDGAIISPVFMLVKKERLELTRPVADFLASPEMGSILTNQGLFPSLHPDVKNVLPENPRWKWIGWDYLHDNDVAALLKHALKIFEDTVGVSQ
ncbi:Domain of unknown function DUF1858 [Desulfurispirillum indicum S5]|uniref:DUF1858 domain-containing protein n=1 Tax=Desulfurispirillum indicum (strain ATCC BAA-1389 / DSM 22839 / S5) TaxID=653733 RepID=E6W5W9_DESIS|nr:ABC transporter substrate-binding protein [Desulfurispirillum indicum]ADU67254.1 Domain of unknown function DUF1858 [Desulfurispirillum indicum S5]